MRAILHIGIEKTGTTSIQRACMANRKKLAAAGYHYCTLCQESGRHDFLPFLAAQPGFSDTMVEAVDLFGPRKAAEAKVRNLLSAELKTVSRGSNVVFSSENCHRTLFTTECVSRLKDFLKEFFDCVEVVIYLRRQDRVAVSAYSTHLRMGGASFDPFQYDTSVLEYEHLMYRWTATFGPTAVKAHIYDEIVKSGGSVVNHFVRSLDIDEFPETFRENARLSAVEQSLMQLVNHQMDRFDGNTIRSAISLTVSRMAQTLRSNVPRSAAIAYMQQFAESNERVRGGYFPSIKSLFDDDYSEYPEHLLSEGEALTALAIGSLAEGGRIIADLEHQIRLLRSAQMSMGYRPRRFSGIFRRALRASLN